MGRGRMAPVIQEIIRKPVSMAAQPGGSAFPDTAAVSLADGGADDCAEEVCQTGGAAGIYGMISARRAFVQNREILSLLPCIRRCTGSYGKDGSCHGFAVIYTLISHNSFFKKDVFGKGATSSPDAPDAMDIMTDAMLCRIRKNHCFLL